MADKSINEKHIEYVSKRTGIDKETVEKVLIADIEYMDLIIEGIAEE